MTVKIFIYNESKPDDMLNDKYASSDIHCEQLKQLWITIIRKIFVYSLDIDIPCGPLT